MSDRSITIRTVTAAPFLDCGKMLTPRLRLVVSYSEGGVSLMTYKKQPRGYIISVRHDRLSDEGWVSMIMDGKGNPTWLVEEAKRFSAKTLERIADEVRNGKHNAIVDHLYAISKNNRSEYEWPTSILEQSNVTDELQLA